MGDGGQKEPYKHSEEEVRLFFRRTKPGSKEKEIEDLVGAALALGTIFTFVLATLNAPAS